MFQPSVMMGVSYLRYLVLSLLPPSKRSKPQHSGEHHETNDKTVAQVHSLQFNFPNALIFPTGLHFEIFD
jgi:hypothetical protein